MNKITNKRTITGWIFSKKKINQVINDLEIKYPVFIKFPNIIAAHLSPVQGTHDFKNNCHIIEINPLIGKNRGSEVLWHELCHALQVKMFPKYSDYLEAYCSAGGNFFEPGYKDNIFEIEAREFEKNHEELCLTTYWR